MSPFQPSFAFPGNSTTVGSSFHSNISREKKVYVSGVGTATQLPNGEIQVRYSDGCLLSIDGKQKIRYQYSDGNAVTFSDRDTIPKSIRERLKQMPEIVEYLMPTTTRNFRV